MKHFSLQGAGAHLSPVKKTENCGQPSSTKHSYYRNCYSYILFPAKMKCGSLEKKPTLDLGQEAYQINLKHLFVSESKAAFRDNRITVLKLYLKKKNYN